MSSSSPATFAAHRILFIPELLDIVFNFLDRQANTTNARVCKSWTDIALDVVWKEVDDVIRLFRLLKPITHGPTHEYRFQTLPEASDWSRFEKYAARVRSLKFQSSKYDADICPLLDDVARTRTSLEILPNMHTLEWLYSALADMERCKLFLHRRLRTLTVTAPCQPFPRPDFYTDLCARAPHLHTLTLFVKQPGNPIDAELHILLQNLPELKKIVLSEFHYTSAVVEHLSRAKNIQVLDFNPDLELGCGKPENVTSFFPVLGDGAFPCLRDLNLSARIDDLDRFFRSSFAPVRITMLFVNSYAEHSPTEIQSFFVTLSQQCQLLSNLSVQLYHKALLPTFPADQQLSYETIKPVLAFPNLTLFELAHKYPLRITQDEIEDLASKWPHLETLVLNSEPLFFLEELAPTNLDLRALLPFARHCPRLRLIGLYLEAGQVDDDDAPATTTMTNMTTMTTTTTTAAAATTTRTRTPHGEERFSALRTLSVGTSSVQDANAAAMFLSRIVPTGCQLEMGISWTEFGTEHDRRLPLAVWNLLQARCMAWRAVERVLPALMSLREEERERARVLREEVEDLRVRNRLLMDREMAVVGAGAGAGAGKARSRDSCVVA